LDIGIILEGLKVSRDIVEGHPDKEIIKYARKELNRPYRNGNFGKKLVG
jgi:hypothetical protein